MVKQRRHSSETKAPTLLVMQEGLLRAGLKAILDAFNFDVIFVGSSINKFDFETLGLKDQPVILVLHDEHPQDTVSQIREFKVRYSKGRVCVLLRGRHRYRPGEIYSIFSAGANVFLNNDVTSATLIGSLESATDDSLVILTRDIAMTIIHFVKEIIHAEKASAQQSPEVGILRTAATGLANTAKLSCQEKRILTHLTSGDTNKVIARKLQISEATVKAHVKAILRKIQVENRTQAAMWAINHLGPGTDLDPTAERSVQNAAGFEVSNSRAESVVPENPQVPGTPSIL